MVVAIQMQQLFYVFVYVKSQDEKQGEKSFLANRIFSTNMKNIEQQHCIKLSTHATSLDDRVPLLTKKFYFT